MRSQRGGHSASHDTAPGAKHATPSRACSFDRFLLLPIGAAIALVWANTAAESYFAFAQAPGVPRQRDRHGVLLRAHHAGDRRGGDAGRRAAHVAALGAAGRRGRRRHRRRSRLSTSPTSSLQLRGRADDRPGRSRCAIDIAAAYYVLKTIMPRERRCCRSRCCSGSPPTRSASSSSRRATRRSRLTPAARRSWCWRSALAWRCCAR